MEKFNQKFNKLTEQQVIKALTEIGTGLTKDIIAYYINISKVLLIEIEGKDYSKANLLNVYNNLIRYENHRIAMFKNNNILKALVLSKSTLK